MADLTRFETLQKDAAVAIAADYADSLITLRRAKGVVELLLLLMLLGQVALFAIVRFGDVLPGDATTRPAAPDLLAYATMLTASLGLLMGILLPVILLLTHHVMLVGRLIGVNRVTAALVWSVVLLLMLVPWQSFLATGELTSPEKVIPGVVYSWAEVRENARFDADLSAEALLRWFRFVGAPVVAMVVLLIIRLSSGRGLRMALGDEPLPEIEATRE